MPEDFNKSSAPIDHEPKWLLPEHIVPLLTELDIKQRTGRIARQIATKYEGKQLTVIVILKGSFIYAADLLRRFYDYNLTPQIDFIRAASYGYGDISSGKVSLQLDVSLDLTGSHVLLVDDIADSGVTLSFLVKHILRKGAVSVETCVLLDKPSNRMTEFVPDYIGFEIPNTFVVGYGLDYGEQYRTLPFIIALQHRSEG